MRGVMRREERDGGEAEGEGPGQLLIEGMRGVGAERGDGGRVGSRGEVWAEDLTQMMSFSLYHGNLRNAFSKSSGPIKCGGREGGREGGEGRSPAS